MPEKVGGIYGDVHMFIYKFVYLKRRRERQKSNSTFYHGPLSWNFILKFKYAQQLHHILLHYQIGIGRSFCCMFYAMLIPDFFSGSSWTFALFFSGFLVASFFSSFCFMCAASQACCSPAIISSTPFTNSFTVS